MLTRRNKTGENTRGIHLMGIPEETQDMAETDTALWAECVASVVDKYPHAEVATLIHIYMFLHPKCKSQLHHLLKRHAIMYLKIRNVV